MKRTLLLLSLSLALSAPAAGARAVPTGAAPRKLPLSTSKAGSSKQETAALTNTKASSGKPSKSKPCYARPVQLLRVRGDQVEPRDVSLTLCNGAPNPAALDSLSVLGRPRDVERPPLPEIRAYRELPIARGKLGANPRAKRYQDPQFVTEHVMRLNPGLLLRLQKIAKHYPGRVIEIISGYRPDARETSRHHHGQALDLRVAGVRRERLRDYLRTFENTGVGYYPNSFFVHMDVRESKGYWVDRSGPGEPADYGPWPSHAPKRAAPKLARVDQARESVLKGALADLEALRGPLAQHRDGRTAMNGGLVSRQLERKLQEPEHQNDDMSQDEVKRAREEARRALEEL
ncbi:MAG: outer membrane protein OmpA/MotB family [Myxococcaceae bacterium]|nr:outer membrane protein OmpA/MotB family [Myxococcaceae bacterium]